MVTTSDIIIAVLLALVIRDLVGLALEWLADTLEHRRFVKELDELLEEIEERNTRAKHPAGKKRAVKKATKRR